MNYLTVSDIPLLRERGFTPGFSGTSWFGIDKTGNTWQAYVVDDDNNLTFVDADDRASIFMERDRFENLFDYV